MLVALDKMEAALESADRFGLDTVLLQEIEEQCHELRQEVCAVGVAAGTEVACTRARQDGGYIYLCDVSSPDGERPAIKDLLAVPELKIIIDKVWENGFLVADVAIRNVTPGSAAPEMGDSLPETLNDDPRQFCLIVRKQRSPIRSI